MLSRRPLIGTEAMEELRSQIWDCLYHASKPMTLAEIARQVGSDIIAVRVAVNHEWFRVSAGLVSIAYRNQS